jgi:hypothetical protein
MNVGVRPFLLGQHAIFRRHAEPKNRGLQEGQSALSTCSNVVITPTSMSPQILSRKSYMPVSNEVRLSAREWDLRERQLLGLVV